VDSLLEGDGFKLSVPRHDELGAHLGTRATPTKATGAKPMMASLASRARGERFHIPGSETEIR
jgi:hypothetical protein